MHQLAKHLTTLRCSVSHCSACSCCQTPVWAMLPVNGIQAHQLHTTCGSCDPICMSLTVGVLICNMTHHIHVAVMHQLAKHLTTLRSSVSHCSACSCCQTHCCFLVHADGVLQYCGIADVQCNGWAFWGRSANAGRSHGQLQELGSCCSSCWNRCGGSIDLVPAVIFIFCSFVFWDTVVVQEEAAAIAAGLRFTFMYYWQDHVHLIGCLHVRGAVTE